MPFNEREKRWHDTRNEETIHLATRTYEGTTKVDLELEGKSVIVTGGSRGNECYDTHDYGNRRQGGQSCRGCGDGNLEGV